MNQAEQLPSQSIKLSSVSTLAGVLIATAIMGVSAISLVLLLSVNIANLNFFVLFIAILWQTFLYTGLFITAHDAMHGTVFPENTKINHLIGSMCAVLYGCLPYKALLRKHWMHHRYPASDLDPDFHDGKNKNFFAWYLHFMKGYATWSQMILITIIYNSSHYILHIPRANLNYFWAVPCILSSLQLFYFGTFLPHREPQDGYSEPHRARTISYPIWWSFLTCYHFGYHYEHHEYPNVPWWQLPKVHRENVGSL
ncbi:fatty acid desaturase [Aetokthonos hydrillicola Thurmond2011]|uniref:Fatty acid desaturase n=1 Tax=Aetokthonos hydrillicola Thurmond2011 TaxID=2712845 RepID=A0AAP5IEP3_9CYAN|nr:fatty acid desaturase [Aetokthonos hydrillicola]MDR9898692.1 fatty acid desaturase [Aetokthonos hydrillicola Thurmond2011]